MNSNHLDRQPQLKIADELLSAYLDGEVTAQERAQVERALAQDSETAWRLASLQQTVTLVKALPRASLPRSFTLREVDVMPTRGAGDAAAPWWRTLFSPALLRNGMAIAALLFIVLSVGDLTLSRSAPAPAASDALMVRETVVVEMVPAATPAIAAAKEAIPSPTAATEIVVAAAAQATTTPTATTVVMASRAPGTEVATTMPPPAPSAGASGALVTTVPATGAPIIELMAPPADRAVTAQDSSAHTPAAPAGPNLLRSAQVLLALLTTGLFVAWRRSLLRAR